MSLVISKVFTYDTDAGNYIQAVEGASGDNQTLEPAVRQAINNFVIGCKQDGIWTAIKASCILAGARTTNGALVPLKGTAPTPVNFDLVNNTDYNRKTGLAGNGSTKYLDSVRNTNADFQNSYSVSVWVSSAGTPASSTQLYLGGSSSTGGTSLGIAFSQLFSRNRSSAVTFFGASSTTGFFGSSRASSAAYTVRYSGNNLVVQQAAESPANSTTHVFAESAGTSYRSNARLAFYSIGESLDLARLDSRVTDLINAFGAAIP